MGVGIGCGFVRSASAVKDPVDLRGAGKHGLQSKDLKLPAGFRAEAALQPKNTLSIGPRSAPSLPTEVWVLLTAPMLLRSAQDE